MERSNMDLVKSVSVSARYCACPFLRPSVRPSISMSTTLFVHLFLCHVNFNETTLH